MSTEPLADALVAHLERERSWQRERVEQIAELEARVAAVERRLDEAPAPPPPSPDPDPDPEPEWRGPQRITRGGTYHSWWHSDDGPAVVIDTTEPVVIRGRVRGRAHLIAAVNGARVTVEGAALESLGSGRAVIADRVASLTVRACDLTDTNGIYVHASGGAGVLIERNRALNIGRHRRAGEALVQFVQLDKCQGVRGGIRWNEVTNEPDRSSVEDVINLFASGGAPGAPFLIEHNLIRGAYPQPAATAGFSGGGIIVGDHGGEHAHVRANTVLDTVNYGVAIAGGRHNRLAENLVLGANRVGDRIAAGANIGAYVWHQRGSADAGDNGGSGNRVAWVRADGVRNDWWTPDASFWTSNEHAPDPTPELLDQAHAAWRSAARTAGWRF